jgi:2-keto-4-pentenoate hydratase
MPIALQQVATHFLSVFDDAVPCTLLSEEHSDLDLSAAYAVSDRVMQMRQARGEQVVGYKIGFTNTTIWQQYNVLAPIFGAMYNTSVFQNQLGKTVSLKNLVQPRIEPEIVFRLKNKPSPDMTIDELWACIDAATHGFELVQSPFADWRFTASDAVAASALHGRLYFDQWQPVPSAHSLANFSIDLFKQQTGSQAIQIDSGKASNVLGSPLLALAHLVKLLATRSNGRGLLPGDIITTGTVTNAHGISAGQRWHTSIANLALTPMSISFD